MNTNTFKYFTIVLGFLSMLFSIKEIYYSYSIFNLGELDFLEFISKNVIFTYILLSPLSIIGVFISCFGLYKERVWGFLLSNVCLFIFISGFIFAFANIFRPGLFDLTLTMNNGKNFSYLPNLDLMNSMNLIFALIVLIFLSFQFIKKRKYYK